MSFEDLHTDSAKSGSRFFLDLKDDLLVLSREWGNDPQELSIIIPATPIPIHSLRKTHQYEELWIWWIGIYPLVNIQKANWKITIEIVSFPIKTSIYKGFSMAMLT